MQGVDKPTTSCGYLLGAPWISSRRGERSERPGGGCRRGGEAVGCAEVPRGGVQTDQPGRGPKTRRHEDRLDSSGGVCPFGGLGVACAGLTTVLGVPGPSSGTR